MVDRDTHAPRRARLALMRAPAAGRRPIPQPEGRPVSRRSERHGAQAQARSRVDGWPARELVGGRVPLVFQHGTATSERTFSQVESIEVDGVDPDTEIEFSAADFSRGDVTQLLPLWAGVPDARRAAALVTRTLLDPNRYWRAYGLPVVPADDPTYRPDRQEVWRDQMPGRDDPRRPGVYGCRARR
jgi:hypothetical protein